MSEFDICGISLVALCFFAFFVHKICDWIIERNVKNE